MNHPLCWLGLLLWGGLFMFAGLRYHSARLVYLRSYRRVHGVHFDLPGDPMDQVESHLTRQSGGFLWTGQWKWWSYTHERQRDPTLEQARRRVVRLELLANASLFAGMALCMVLCVLLPKL